MLTRNIKTAGMSSLALFGMVLVSCASVLFCRSDAVIIDVVLMIVVSALFASTNISTWA